MDTTLLTTTTELVEVQVTPGASSTGLTFMERVEDETGRRGTICYSRDVEPVPVWETGISFLEYVLDMPEAQSLRSGWVIEVDPESGCFRAVILTTPQAAIAVC